MLLKLGVCFCDRKIVINISIFINNRSNLLRGYYLKYYGRYFIYIIFDSYKIFRKEIFIL